MVTSIRGDKRVRRASVDTCFNTGYALVPELATRLGGRLGVCQVGGT